MTRQGDGDRNPQGQREVTHHLQQADADEDERKAWKQDRKPSSPQPSKQDPKPEPPPTPPKKQQQ
jgi:hypothetical protein